MSTGCSGHGVEDERIQLFGQEIEVGKLEHSFSHVKLASSKKELRERLAGTKAPNIKVEFACTEPSELIVRRMKKGDSVELQVKEGGGRT